MARNKERTRLVVDLRGLDPELLNPHTLSISVEAGVSIPLAAVEAVENILGDCGVSVKDSRVAVDTLVNELQALGLARLLAERIGFRDSIEADVEY